MRLLWSLFLVHPIWAQDAFLSHWEALRGAQPASVELRIAAPKAKFYLGETIPLTLSFTANTANQPGSFVADSRLQDRVGRLNLTEKFIADPIAATEDPLRGLPGEGGSFGGLSGGNRILTADKPFTVARNLNEWLRFRAPGTYRLYVVSGRVRSGGTGHTAEELQFFASSIPVEVVSNVLTLEIVAAPPEWVSEQIAAAIAILDAPAGNDSESQRARQQAGLTLRFLNTVESGIALAKRLPDRGILDSHHRAELLPVMEQLLVAPSQAITESFLATLAQLAVLVESGRHAPASTLPSSGPGGAESMAGGVAAARGALAKKRDYFVSMLVAALPDKEPEARALTRDTLLSVAEALSAPPPWLTGIVESMIVDFRGLPPQVQSRLLESRWRLLRDKDVLPLLEDLFANPPRPPLGYPSINELVLRRIYELNPERGRQLILKELHRPDGPLIGDSTLMLLPDENLPELNDVFAAKAARGGPLPARLITRYASGQIVKEIEAGYLAFNADLDRQKLPHYASPLMFYFLKFDPKFGEQELRKAFAAGPYDIGRAFESLGSYAMSPALERVAIEHLTSSAVPIKRGAAEVLGKYGSAAAQQPLWETMEYFHSWWKDREDDLRKLVGQEGMFLERTLVTSLAQAGSWVLGQAELRRLLANCSSAECRARVEEWIRQRNAQ